MSSQLPNPKRAIATLILLFISCMVAVWVPDGMIFHPNLPKITLEKLDKTGTLLVYMSALVALISGDLPARYKSEKDRIREESEKLDARISLLLDLSNELTKEKFDRRINEEEERKRHLLQQSTSLKNETTMNRIGLFASITLLMLGTLGQLLS